MVELFHSEGSWADPRAAYSNTVSDAVSRSSVDDIWSVFASKKDARSVSTEA